MTVSGRSTTSIADMKLVFAGTPDFAARHLAALIESDCIIQAVYTQPDRPAGRGKKLAASPVKCLALEHDLKLEQPHSLKAPETQATLAKYAPDAIVVVAYGLLLPQAVLDIPRYGCLNVHASLLPRWRGAAPIQRAIEAGDTQSGVTIMQMEAGLDTGPMWVKRVCDISSSDTASSLHDKLAELGCPALLDTLALCRAGEQKPEPQVDDLSTYASKIEKHEAEINWHLPASQLALQIRAFNPFPMSYTHWRGQRWRILSADPVAEASGVPGTVVRFDKQALRVACGEGALDITSVQLPGKKPMAVEHLLNGYSKQITPGALFD